MMTAQSAISRFRRDVTLGALLRGALFAAAALCLALSASPGHKAIDGTLLLMGVGFLWLVLSYQSIKGQRLAAQSPSLIASGEFDAAEQQIEQALRSFSLFRTAKVISLHHLAVLRHAQKRWQDSAALSRTLLGQRLGALKALSRPSRLLLADALLELGDVGGAYHALVALYDQRLSLGEAMNLLLVQLDYESRIGAWEAMLPKGATYKRVQLAELMPSASGARAHALLALAAKKLGRDEWSTWLRRRAELLGDPQEIMKERPVLAELWQT
jgi:hypothetical protein